ncbi:Arm DNA-binding domain-containing protein [Alistipes sp.]|uniref:Arm DNA-binding domain-containing protein n=1 Tax=Alistipes sp. TaxID=1872444 RepID=UPI003AEFE64A
MNYSRDGITVAAMIDTSHPKKDGLFPVRIRVTYARERRYYPTGKSLTLEEWEALPATKARTLIAIRKDIESSYQIVRTVVEDLAMRRIFSLENLNSRLKRVGSDTLTIAFESKITEMRVQDRIGNMMAYQVVMKGIKRFAGDRVSLSSVTEDWVWRYE